MKLQKQLHLLCAVLILGFLVGTYNGRLAVWKGNDPEPYRVYPCPVYLLPQKEQEALRKGIRINSMDDVGSFLENFLS